MHTTVLFGEEARVHHNGDWSGPVLLVVPSGWIENSDRELAATEAAILGTQRVCVEIPEAAFTSLIEAHQAPLAADRLRRAARLCPELIVLLREGAERLTCDTMPYKGERPSYVERVQALLEPLGSEERGREQSDRPAASAGGDSPVGGGDPAGSGEPGRPVSSVDKPTTSAWAKVVEASRAAADAASPPSPDPFDVLGPFCDARLANTVHEVPGVPPTASLVEAAAALEAIARRERTEKPSSTVRLRPDPRLVAAILTCRDYDGCDPADVEPIIALEDPDDPNKIKVVCVLSVTKKSWAAEQR